MSEILNEIKKRKELAKDQAVINELDLLLKFANEQKIKQDLEMIDILVERIEDRLPIYFSFKDQDNDDIKKVKKTLLISISEAIVWLGQNASDVRLTSLDLKHLDKDSH